MQRTDTDSVPAAPLSPPVSSSQRTGVPPKQITDNRMLYKAMVRWDDSLFPEYNTKLARLKTYSQWPHAVAPLPEKMAEAGFFCTGTNTFIIIQS